MHSSVSTSAPSGQTPASAAAPASLLRSAAWFTLFPLVIGLVQWGMDCTGRRGCGSLSWGALHLLAALLGFLVWLTFTAWLTVRARGPSHALRLSQDCPACGRRQHIVNTVCIGCAADLGLPPASRTTYALCMQAFLLFELMLVFKPLRFIV